MKNKKHATNTSAQEPLLNLFASMGGIENQERQGQQEIIDSCQLPSRWNTRGTDTKKQYKLMGIKVIGESEGDPLFLDVVLPKGWKKEHTSHSMWNNLVDDKGRVRAIFFYKAAFYDRDAFISFERRYKYNFVKYLTQDERGEYVIKKVSVRNPDYQDFDEKTNDNVDIIHTSHGIYWYNNAPEFITKEEKVWISKYKNTYAERNATPHYIAITDGEKVIYSTKDNPIYYTKIYRKDRHRMWWKGYEKIEEDLRKKVENYLKKHYPNHKDINAYWD